MRGAGRATDQGSGKHRIAITRRRKDGTAEYYAQGVTEGWKDVYEWYLPHQYIEITGLPDGTYILETIADPESRLLESDESNNCGSVYVQLTGISSPRPSAKILGDGPTCKDIQKALSKQAR